MQKVFRGKKGKERKAGRGKEKKKNRKEKLFLIFGLWSIYIVGKSFFK